MYFNTIHLVVLSDNNCLEQVSVFQHHICGCAVFKCLPGLYVCISTVQTGCTVNRCLSETCVYILTLQIWLDCPGMCLFGSCLYSIIAYWVMLSGNAFLEQVYAMWTSDELEGPSERAVSAYKHMHYTELSTHLAGVASVFLTSMIALTTTK